MALPILACGPWMPNRLLSQGGSGLLEAPTATFAREIAIMKLQSSQHSAVPATNSLPAEAADAEIADLRSALTATGRSPDAIDRIVAAHQVERAALRAVAEATLANPVNSGIPAWPAPASPPASPASAAVLTNNIRVVDGLPGEFADYFRGAIAWHGGATNTAIAAWKALLSRPPTERPLRSTWAAFMLGRAGWETDPAAAIRYFQLTRELAAQGFADRLGLAASSLGWEARIELRRDRFERAIDLYLEQSDAGDKTALWSLRFAAELALKRSARSLESLARHSRAQKVITAYLISGGWSDAPVDIDGPMREPIAKLLDKQTWISAPANGWHRFESPALLWLRAVESARIRDVDSAEKLALAAYQSGHFDLARRWLERAPAQPAAQWLKAKLALRDGDLSTAGSLLSKIARQFPATPSPSPETPGALPEPAELFQRLQMNHYWTEAHRDPRRQALGEWGALRLARRDYPEALDALFRAGYTEDAAYVADRVLTLAELQAYVDRAWPADPGGLDAGHDHYYVTPRAWLGWRLVRAGSLAEAERYLHSDDRLLLKAYTSGLEVGRNGRLPASERAAALWETAKRVLESRLNVFKCPAETDWQISSGFQITNTPPLRLQAPAGPGAIVLPVSTDESDRVEATAIFPSRAWYYRYIAADLAWESSRLMPDNAPQTAHVLWQAGTWLKAIDPDRADRFYKALVNRCRETPLGREADRKRWFPSADIARLLSQAPTPGP